MLKKKRSTDDRNVFLVYVELFFCVSLWWFCTHLFYFCVSFQSIWSVCGRFETLCNPLVSFCILVFILCAFSSPTSLCAFSVVVLCQLVVVQSANMFHLLHASFKKFPHPLVFIVSSFSLVNVSVISLSPFLVLWMSFLLFLFHLTLQEEISLNTKALRLGLWPADLGSNCSMSVLMSGLGKLCELIRNKTCIY